MNKKLIGSVLLFAAAVLWGTTFVAQSKGMEYVEPFTYNSIRMYIGGIVLIPVVLVFGRKNQKNSTAAAVDTHTTVKGGICCGVVLFAASSLQQCGMVMTSAGKAGFITALYIVIVPLFELILFKRRAPAALWFCIVIAAFGFYLLCIKKGFTLDKGDVLILFCSFFFAGHIIVVDHFNKRGVNGILMSCLQFFTAGTLMLIVMLLKEKPVLDSIIAARYTILYAGIMSSGLAYTFQIIGQKHTPPAIATLTMSLESVIAAVSGWAVLGEHLSHKELLGCVLVFAAVLASQFTPSSDKKGAEVHVLDT